MSASSRWRAFAISHTGGQTWDKAWTFAADQPFDVGYVQVMDLIYSTAYQSTTKPAKHYICFACVALPPPHPPSPWTPPSRWIRPEFAVRGGGLAARRFGVPFGRVRRDVIVTTNVGWTRWHFCRARCRFGPGYNCEHGLISARNRTKLLLSKPTATLHGDANGAPHARCSPGSCVRPFTPSLRWSTFISSSSPLFFPLLRGALDGCPLQMLSVTPADWCICAAVFVLE